MKRKVVYVVHGITSDGDLNCLGVFESEKDAEKLQDEAYNGEYNYDDYEDGVVYVEKMIIE